MLRLEKDGSYREGRFEENFIPLPQGKGDYDGILGTYVLHYRKNGENFQRMKSGYIGIIPGSAATECVKGLIYGCGDIDLFMADGKTIAAFRDCKVMVSQYLGITDMDIEGMLKIL